MSNKVETKKNLHLTFLFTCMPLPLNYENFLLAAINFPVVRSEHVMSSGYLICTSSILEADIRKPPHMGETHRQGDAGEEEVKLVPPMTSPLVAVLLPFIDLRILRKCLGVLKDHVLPGDYI